MTPIVKKMDPDYKSNGNIKWNFTKFLIDREGNIVQRYEPTAKTDDIKEKLRRFYKMFHYDYLTTNTCSSLISLDLDGNVVHNIKFIGGCNGNLKAISLLLEGRTVEEIESKLSGVLCGNRPTSCSDQLAKAARAAYNASLDPDYRPDFDED